jgi:hypothetical protein
MAREEEEEEEEEEDPNVDTKRLKVYVKPRIYSVSQEVLDRRARKNAQSRARAAKLRERVAQIELKPISERTPSEQNLFELHNKRRSKKNNRSRERALERKEEVDRILAKPESQRTKLEKQFLENVMDAKKRKNEGDRNRRSKLKELGAMAKTNAMWVKSMSSPTNGAAAKENGMPPYGYAYPPPPYGYAYPPPHPHYPPPTHHHQHHHLPPHYHGGEPSSPHGDNDEEQHPHRAVETTGEAVTQEESV